MLVANKMNVIRKAKTLIEERKISLKVNIDKTENKVLKRVGKVRKSGRGSRDT